MNKLPPERRAQILGMMVEGFSIRTISQMTGASKNTVVKLLADTGEAFSDYQDRTLRGLTCKRIRVDEIWSFVYAKQKNIPTAKAAPADAGDIWTWTAIDADTKLIPSWYLGARDAEAAKTFINDLAGRLKGRVELACDGHKAYLEAVEGAFGADVDFAMLVKIYGQPPEAEKRYSPVECVGAVRQTFTGKPDPKHVSTGFAERQNLLMRMDMQRFTQLTKAFSKKAENRAHAIAIYFMHYNFVRLHKTLRCTPAMAAGVTDRIWDIGDMVAVLNAMEAAPAKRSPYMKRGEKPVDER